MSDLLNWKVRLALGIIFLCGMAGSLIYGFVLKSEGGAFNQIWMLSLLFAMAAIHQLQKAVRKEKGKKEIP